MYLFLFSPPCLEYHPNPSINGLLARKPTKRSCFRKAGPCRANVLKHRERPPPLRRPPALWPKRRRASVRVTGPQCHGPGRARCWNTRATVTEDTLQHTAEKVRAQLSKQVGTGRSPLESWNASENSPNNGFVKSNGKKLYQQKALTQAVSREKEMVTNLPPLLPPALHEFSEHLPSPQPELTKDVSPWTFWTREKYVYTHGSNNPIKKQTTEENTAPSRSGGPPLHLLPSRADSVTWLWVTRLEVNRRIQTWREQTFTECSRHLQETSFIFLLP